MKSRFSPAEEAERHKLWSETMSSPVFESSWPKKRKIFDTSYMMHVTMPEIPRKGVKHEDEVRAI